LLMSHHRLFRCSISRLSERRFASGSPSPGCTAAISDCAGTPSSDALRMVMSRTRRSIPGRWSRPGPCGTQLLPSDCRRGLDGSLLRGILPHPGTLSVGPPRGCVPIRYRENVGFANRHLPGYPGAHVPPRWDPRLPHATPSPVGGHRTASAVTSRRASGLPPDSAGGVDVVAKRTPRMRAREQPVPGS
jgi:hypothetical protein